MPDPPLLYRFDSLNGPGIRHGISLRAGGMSHCTITGLNLGHTVGDDPVAVEGNHALLYAELGLTPDQIVTARQVHGAHVARVGPDDGGTVIPATDGLITDAPGIALLMRYADCVPVLLYDSQRNAIGLAHAGWRGALARVAARTAEAMLGEFGCRPSDIRAAIGPSIGPCCCEVGPEVAEATRVAFPDETRLLCRVRPTGHAYLDLWEAVATQLREAGVDQIETARMCTACRGDLFYSYRRQGAASGRFCAIIGLGATGV
ncbi:MAG: peptidoglycan editing factor PgeF [Anaerolineae bacterium]